MELKQAVACLQDKVDELSVVQAEKVNLEVSWTRAHLPCFTPPFTPALKSSHFPPGSWSLWTGQQWW